MCLSNLQSLLDSQDFQERRINRKAQKLLSSLKVSSAFRHSNILITVSVKVEQCVGFCSTKCSFLSLVSILKICNHRGLKVKGGPWFRNIFVWCAAEPEQQRPHIHPAGSLWRKHSITSCDHVPLPSSSTKTTNSPAASERSLPGHQRDTWTQILQLEKGVLGAAHLCCVAVEIPLSPRLNCETFLNQKCFLSNVLLFIHLLKNTFKEYFSFSVLSDCFYIITKSTYLTTASILIQTKLSFYYIFYCVFTIYLSDLLLSCSHSGRKVPIFCLCFYICSKKRPLKVTFVWDQLHPWGFSWEQKHYFIIYRLFISSSFRLCLHRYCNK